MSLTPTYGVLAEVAAERERQNERFPDQVLPFGSPTHPSTASSAKARNDYAMENGWLTWNDVLEEEFLEVRSEPDLAKRREELVQLAAVAVRIVEAMDRVERH